MQILLIIAVLLYVVFLLMHSFSVLVRVATISASAGCVYHYYLSARFPIRFPRYSATAVDVTPLNSTEQNVNKTEPVSNGLTYAVGFGLCTYLLLGTAVSCAKVHDEQARDDARQAQSDANQAAQSAATATKRAREDAQTAAARARLDAAAVQQASLAAAAENGKKWEAAKKKLDDFDIACIEDNDPYVDDTKYFVDQSGATISNHFIVVMDSEYFALPHDEKVEEGTKLLRLWDNIYGSDNSVFELQDANGDYAGGPSFLGFSVEDDNQ